MNHFEVMKRLETDNNRNLEQIHNLYTRVNKNIDSTKDELLDKMDSIYNNFVIVSRWNY